MSLVAGGVAVLALAGAVIAVTRRVRRNR
ncbi:hypothetical protein [Okibacterium fritillariae]